MRVCLIFQFSHTWWPFCPKSVLARDGKPHNSLKFGGIADSGSGQLLAVEKFPKNPRWPPAHRGPFCVFVQRKVYLLQFALNLLETWYTCSLGGRQ